MAGCDLLCFLDCYSGYHQIAIKEEGQEKTAFITPFGAYCYTTMSLGLKNAGATYQRAIQACFKRQLNKNVEAYVDDVVVKTRDSSTLVDDLEETFASLRSNNQQLLPNLPSKIQMANTLKLRITQASDQVINGFCICLILGLSTGIGHHKSVYLSRNSIGLVKHNKIQQLATKKDHHTSRPLVVTLPIEVRRTAPLNIRHLRIQDLAKSPRIRHQALILIEGSDDN
jgi:hypothetical protein